VVQFGNVTDDNTFEVVIELSSIILFRLLTVMSRIFVTISTPTHATSSELNFVPLSLPYIICVLLTCPKSLLDPRSTDASYSAYRIYSITLPKMQGQSKVQSNNRVAAEFHGPSPWVNE
jgi:hypothetical protein